MKYYPIAEPIISKLEKQYVNDCLNTSWISSQGKYVKKFEQAFAKFNKTKYTSVACNGTVSLQLILLALDIRKGDEIIVPNFTYVATVNPVLYVGAKPIFIDCDIDTYNISSQEIEKKISKKTKAIIITHLYGNPCEMDKIMKIAKKHNIYIIEDAAEAHGAKFKNKMIGSFGIANSFSFFGNKTITTGEGGMITTNSKKIFDKINLLKNQGQHPKDKKYFHRMLGYNYRMTNIQAAIGLAQLTKINNFIRKKKQINQWYKAYLSSAIKKNIVVFQKETNNAQHSYWMTVLTVKNFDVNKLAKGLKKEHIDTRPFFTPMNKLPFLKSYFNKKDAFINSEKIYKQGIIIPCGTSLNKKDIKIISNKILKILNL